MGQNQTLNERIDRWLELLIVWTLLASVLGLLSALAGHFLAAQVCLAAVLVAGVYAWFTRKARGAARVTPDWRHLAVLTLLCLFFRLPAYHYVLGGQDEGVYVNVAHHLARTGGIDTRDTALEKLADSPLTARYLKENRNTAYLPGVYLAERSGPRLQFQFYHLFPVWMAIFEGLFGATFGIYALTFFAWLSVVFIYRLALSVSGSQRVALVAGALLAVNPLHAFFSKFPVTEVPALAFSLIGFTCLALGRDRDSAGGRSQWFWLSAAAFGGLFVTRISGFMYMPFVLAAAAASAIGDRESHVRRAMFYWCAAVLLLYALSVGYGLRWSGLYARDIYRLSFERLFPANWQVGVTCIAIFLLISWLAIAAISRPSRGRETLQRYLLAPAQSMLGVIVALGLCAGLFKVYQLGWTHRFDEDAWLGSQWHLANSGWLAAEASSLFQLLIYTGPLLLVSIVLLGGKKDDPRIEFLRLFAAGFLVYAALLQWVVPYGPYYARYLLSENVPYLILLAVLVWAAMAAGWRKTLVSLVLGISLIYMAIASAGQLGKSENAGLYASLQRMLAPVDASDLVLMTSLSPGWPSINQIKTPVLYTFGRQVISVSDSSANDHAYTAALDARFDDVFLVSTNPFPPQGFELVNSEHLRVWSFARSFWPPHELTLNAEKRLYLYRLARSVLPLAHKVAFNAQGAWNAWLVSGWSTQESWGTWSSGRHAELSVDPRELPAEVGGIRLRFEANVLVTPQHTRQRIEVALNGAALIKREVTYPQSTISIDVDIPENDLRIARKLVIAFDLPDAASPQAIGMGVDGRVLALGLKSVTALPLGTQSPVSGHAPER